MVGQGAEIVAGGGDVAEGAVIGHAAGLADAGAVGGGVALTFAEVQVGGDADVAVVGQLTSHFLGSLVPAGHVMNQDDAGEGAGAQGPGQVGVNLVAVVAIDVDGFRN